MRWLSDPFAYAFFPRALLVLVLAGGICGALGSYVIVRRMAYIAHGLSHAVIGGAAVAGALQVNVLLGAGIWAFLSALVIERVARRRGLYADTAIGIVTTASFAIGIAIISTSGRWERNLENFLFGNILGIDAADIVLAVVVALVLGVTVLARYRPLLAVTFDKEVAAIHGVRADRYEMLFSLLLTAGVVASMRVLGVLLVAAAVVIPPATARILTARFEVLLPLATVLGAAVAVPGLYVSYYLDIPPGPAIVLAQVAVMTVAAVVAVVRERRRAPSVVTG